MLTQPQTWAKFALEAEVQTALERRFLSRIGRKCLNAAHSALIYVGIEGCVIYREHVCNHNGSRVKNECHML